MLAVDHGQQPGGKVGARGGQRQTERIEQAQPDTVDDFRRNGVERQSRREAREALG
jgi:hypothetical protein